MKSQASKETATMTNKGNRTPIPTQLEWEDPEPRTRKGSAWEPVARALKAHPGKWACIGRNIPTSVITQINRGDLKCFQPEGHFEAVTPTTPVAGKQTSTPATSASRMLERMTQVATTG